MAPSQEVCSAYVTRQDSPNGVPPY